MTKPTTATACSVRGGSEEAVGEPGNGGHATYVLDPSGLPDHIDALYRAAWALCGSQHDAEDLVQTTFAQVLKRPRTIRLGNDRAYLLRALRNTYGSRYGALARQLPTVPLVEQETDRGHEPADVSSHELMAAIAAAPPHYRDAVIAVDVLGLSYPEAARSLGTREATIASRLHRGRQHVARQLIAGGV